MHNLLSANSSLIVDLVALVVIVISVIVGAKKGFARTFISVFSSIFSLIFALLLCGSVATFCQETFGAIDSVSSSVGGLVSRILGDTVANTSLQEFSEEILAESGLGALLRGIIFSAVNNPDIPYTLTLNEIISPVIAYYVVCIISAVGLYIIFKILFYILGKFIESFRKIKVFGTVDSILGVVLGLIRGVIIIQIATIIISIIPIGFLQNLYISIESSSILSFINNINLFELIFTKIVTPDLTKII